MNYGNNTTPKCNTHRVIEENLEKENPENGIHRLRGDN
jgi:hypothetical protein